MTYVARPIAACTHCSGCYLRIGKSKNAYCEDCRVPTKLATVRKRYERKARPRNETCLHCGKPLARKRRDAKWCAPPARCSEQGRSPRSLASRNRAKSQRENSPGKGRGIIPGRNRGESSPLTDPKPALVLVPPQSPSCFEMPVLGPDRKWRKAQ